MSANISTRRLGGGGENAQINAICRFWKIEKCTRNHYRCLHMDLPAPNVYRSVYHRTPKQTEFSLPKRSNNNVYLHDASENKRVKKTCDTSQQIKVNKISNPPKSKNSLASSSTLTELELERSESAKSLESSNSSTEVVNIKKTIALMAMAASSCIHGPMGFLC